MRDAAGLGTSARPAYVPWGCPDSRTSEPTGHRDEGACHEPGGGRRKHQRRARDVIRFRDASHRSQRGNPGGPLWVPALGVYPRVGGADTNGIYADALWRQFLARAKCDGFHSTLGGGIVNIFVRTAQVCSQRRHVHDRPAVSTLASRHAFRCLLNTVYDAEDVNPESGFQHFRLQVFYFPGFSYDASIVNQAGYSPKFIVAGAKQGLDVLLLAHVSLHRDGASACGLAALNDFSRSGGVGEVVYADIEALGRKQPSRCGTDAVARTCYDHNRSHEMPPLSFSVRSLEDGLEDCSVVFLSQRARIGRMAVVCNRTLTHPFYRVPGNAQFGQSGRDAQPTVQVVQRIGERRRLKARQFFKVRDLLGHSFNFQVPAQDNRHQDGVESSMMKLRLLKAAQRMAEGMDSPKTLLERHAPFEGTHHQFGP